MDISPRLTGLMNILVEILGRDRTIKLDVKASDTIASIKAKIKWQSLIPLDHQRLIYGNDTQLEDSRQLSEYNIRYSSHLKLAVKRPGDMSTQVGCTACEITFSMAHDDWVNLWLCEACAANNAIAGEFDPTDYDNPPKKQRRTR